MGSETLLSESLNHGEINTFTASSASNKPNHSIAPHLHPVSPMPFIATSSVGSSSSVTNQSKENLDEYHLKDYHKANTVAASAQRSYSRSSLFEYSGDHDEISTQSSHFTHHSKESSHGLGSSGNSNSGRGSGLHRSKSRTIFSSSEKFQSHKDLKSYYEQEEELERQQQQLFQSQGLHQEPNFMDTHSELQLEPTKFFGRDIKTWTNHSPEEPMFDKHLRHFIDVHIAKARKKREEKYLKTMKKIGAELSYHNSSISSNSYVPYPSLRHERRFLYDVETYPLHQHLADMLGVSDLSLVHQHAIQDKKMLMKPLLDPRKREAFHKCYDNFVTSFCIPLLHSLAMGLNLFNDSSRNDDSQRRISYRYQAFPCIRVNRPGEFSIGPHCDMAYGHSMGNINFHIPLTPTYGTNALYTESHPGREDWHPLKTKSIGLGYSFDGSRNLHFTLENTTEHTRVSIDFRMAIHRDTRKEIIPPSISPENVKMMMNYSQMLKDALHEDERCNDLHDVLCHKKMLEDNFSSFAGYYEEAHVELGTSSSTMCHGHGPGPVVCKRNTSLLHPDKRVGFPF